MTQVSEVSATTSVEPSPGAGSGASAIREALDATVPRLAATLRGAPSGSLAIPGMRWRVGELGAHIAQTATVFTQAAQGQVTAYGQNGYFNARVDQQLVDELAERDPGRLADLTLERYAGLKEAVAGRSDSELLPRLQGYSIAGMHAIWVIDLSVHGHQIGEASGRPFTVDNGALRLALETALPFAFDPEGGRGLHATYAMHIKDAATIVYTVDDGSVRIEPNGAPVDCHLHIDPIAFLLVTLGVIPQWQAIATGKMYAWGRKPWLAARVPKIFPKVPHGGVGKA